MRAVWFTLALAILPGPLLAQSHPFSGTWDCGVAIVSFNEQVYHNGSENLQISDVSEEGGAFILTFEDDYQLSLSLNPDGTLAWFSPVSGDSFTCTPVK